MVIGNSFRYQVTVIGNALDATGVLDAPVNAFMKKLKCYMAICLNISARNIINLFFLFVAYLLQVSKEVLEQSMKHVQS